MASTFKSPDDSARAVEERTERQATVARDAALRNSDSPGPALMAIVLIHVCALLAAAVCVSFQYLRREHARLDLWEAVLIWTADVASLLCFVWCTVGYWTNERRPAERPAKPSERVQMEALVAAIAGVLAIDVGVTVFFLRRDDALLEEAIVTAGEVYRIETLRQDKDRQFLLLHCRFRDRLGTLHEPRFAVRTDLNGEFWGDVPNPMQEPPREATVPFSVEISYVAGSPHKSCVSGLERETGGTLHTFSLTLVSLQAFVLFPFGQFVLGLEKQGEEISRWAHDVFRGLPLIVEAAILLVWGTQVV